MLTEQSVASGRQSVSRHRGPHPGALAVVFTVLFLASLVPVTILAGKMRYPSPLQPAGDIVSFFRMEFENVRLCGFFQFASAVPLGLFTAAMVSRLRFLGVNAAGPTIALFGGLAATLSVATSGIVQWTLSQPGIADDAGLTRAFYFAAFGIGGPGYSVPLGLLIAGLSVPSFFRRLLPRWLCVFGLVLALVGELSTLCLLVPNLLYLVPLTRFPGFIWLIVAGFSLPNSRPREVSQAIGGHGP
jgi:hypothetical protein